MQSPAPPRAPWWMWVLYASFILYAAFVVYNNLLGPEPIGAKFKFAGGRMMLLSVEPDTPAARAGLRPGDIIVRAAGIPIGGLAGWIAARTQVELNVPQAVEVERDGKAFLAELIAVRRVRGGAVLPTRIYPFALAVKLVGFSLAFLILWQRPRDKVALLAAWLFASGASATGVITTGMAASFRQLPFPLALLLVFPFFSNIAAMSTVLLSFCALFPRRLFRGTWPYALMWTPVSVQFATQGLPYFYRVVYRPEQLRDGVPETAFAVSLMLFFLTALAALVVLIVNYQRLNDRNERRRVRVVVAGLVVAWIVVVPLLYAFNLDPNHPLSRLLLHPVALFPAFLLTTAMPGSLAYAVLRHRVFDVRVMVRQGLQYAVARRALVAFVPLMAVLLVGDLMAHRQQTVGEMLRERGWIYVVIGGLALFAHKQRERWLNALDRRFFRERYDAQRLLREVLEDVRRAASLEVVAPTVTAKIEAALHPEWVALLARASAQGPYTAIACAPGAAAPVRINPEAKVLGILRLLEKPLEISSGQSSWLKEQLPHSETEWLRECHVELLIPVALAPGQRETLLALGPKRSEEPYSGEDKEFLLSVAGSLRLLLERPAVAAVAENSFRECPDCGYCGGSESSTCPSDGAGLVVIGVPRLLGGRYRLERRIGRGGMGAVYSARDTALERDVAAKLIREELVGSASAANRFRQEARAAAAFAHRNVVTIHDFGIAGSRAFLVMELLCGRSLRQEVQCNGRLTPGHALAVFQGVCAAVEAAHRRGLIHRDLKPENVYLAQTDEGEVAKILDFGLVKSLTEETQVTRETGAGVLVGTAPYFSPEQWNGEPADAGADCWALAVTMYEALCGAHPFPESTREELRRAVMAGAFREPECLPEWRDFFRRALSAQREKRPSSPSALLTEFELALGRGAATTHA